MTDLSVPSTVYRLTGGCFEPGPAIQLYINAGVNASGTISYRSGRAEFYRGRLDYAGLEESNAETFWFP